MDPKSPWLQCWRSQHWLLLLSYLEPQALPSEAQHLDTQPREWEGLEIMYQISCYLGSRHLEFSSQGAGCARFPWWLLLLQVTGIMPKISSYCPQPSHSIDLKMVYTIYKLILHFSFSLIFCFPPFSLFLMIWTWTYGPLTSFSLSFYQFGFSLMGQIRERCGVCVPPFMCLHVFSCECFYLLYRDILT